MTPAFGTWMLPQQSFHNGNSLLYTAQLDCFEAAASWRCIWYKRKKYDISPACRCGTWGSTLFAEVASFVSKHIRTVPKWYSIICDGQHFIKKTENVELTNSTNYIVIHKYTKILGRFWADFMCITFIGCMILHLNWFREPFLGCLLFGMVVSCSAFSVC